MFGNLFDNPIIKQKLYFYGIQPDAYIKNFLKEIIKRI